MEGINKVILVGNLGADPKSLTTKEGKPFTRFSVATTRSWKSSEGGKEERTDWHHIFVFGKKAENCLLFLKKGSYVAIEGRLSSYETADESGAKKFNTSVTADEVTFLSSQRNH